MKIPLLSVTPCCFVASFLVEDFIDMAHPSTQQAETFTPTEAHVSGGTASQSKAAADAYNPKDSSYASVFPGKASSDKLKSDDQLNSELANISSPYSSDKVATPNHGAGTVPDSNAVNPADRNDNAAKRGENPSSSTGTTAWDPYESLTLPMKGNAVNLADRIDNAVKSGENPPSSTGNTAWDPYESLTLPMKGNAVNPADRNDNAVKSGENPPSSTGNTAWDPYESLTLPVVPYNPGDAQK
jgi:hypothetical protein